MSDHPEQLLDGRLFIEKYSGKIIDTNNMPAYQAFALDYFRNDAFISDPQVQCTLSVDISAGYQRYQQGKNTALRSLRGSPGPCSKHYDQSLAYHYATLTANGMNSRNSHYSFLSPPPVLLVLPACSSNPNNAAIGPPLPPSTTIKSKPFVTAATAITLTTICTTTPGSSEISPPLPFNR